VARTATLRGAAAGPFGPWTVSAPAARARCDPAPVGRRVRRPSGEKEAEPQDCTRSSRGASIGGFGRHVRTLTVAGKKRCERRFRTGQTLSNATISATAWRVPSRPRAQRDRLERTATS